MLPFHPYADLFPLIEGAEFAELVADLKANDLRERIVVLDGAILDGRNRYRAALVAGLLDEDDGPDRTKYFVRFVPSVDGDPLAFVISKNLKRRHLNESQRAMVAARLANMGQGRPSADPEKPANLPVKQPDAAATLSVSERLVRSAKSVQDHGTLELQHAVDQGKLAVSSAAQAAKLDPETQRRIASEAEAGRDNVVRNVIKQQARAAREKDLGEKQLAAPEGEFGVMVEDFEWDHVTWSESGRDRAAENHYPVSKDAHTAAEIVEKTKDRFACAADDCTLFMWATIPHLAIAIDVLRLRGFDYKSHYAWRKPRAITGYWSRGRHEILLIGVKGHPPAPAMGTQEDSCLDGELGEHSQKPDVFMKMIERYFPTMPKLELNSRRSRPGWTVWGLDAKPIEQPHGVLQSSQNFWDDTDPMLDIPEFLRRKPEEEKVESW